MADVAFSQAFSQAFLDWQGHQFVALLSKFETIFHTSILKKTRAAGRFKFKGDQKGD